jgi:hypothetical protein
MGIKDRFVRLPNFIAQEDKVIKVIRGDTFMSGRRTLKSIHLAGTVWFILCVGYILILALRQAGVRWWVIFSLSGHSALLFFLLVSLYLFAIFRGISSSQKVQIEHPLTSTNHYTVFYVITPLLGGLAGCLGMIGVDTIGQFVLGIALGTLSATFLVWVIVDPATALLEMLLPPASRKHRTQRLARAKALREKRQRDRERLLANVLAEEKSVRNRWQELLNPKAEKLAGLLTADRIDFKQAELEAVDIGVNAWQMGGLSCMRQLRDMAMAIARRRNRNKAVVNYIDVWWDGIGSWRNTSLG